MSAISNLSILSVPAARVIDRSSRTIAMFCCVGLLVSFCLIAAGVDASAGWV